MSDESPVPGGDALAAAFLGAVTEGMVYSSKHPRAVAAADRLVDCVSRMGGQAVLYLDEDQVVFDRHPLPEISTPSRRTIVLLQARGLGGVGFRPGLDREEVLALLDALSDPAAARGGLEALRERIGLAGRLELHPVGVLHEGPGSGAVPKAEPGLLVCRRIYENALGIVRHLLDDVRRTGRVDTKRTHAIVSSIAESVLRDRNSWVTLTSLREYDEYTYTHCVNVCAFGIALAEQFTRRFEILVEFGQACLLHDIGKILVPREIVTSVGFLTTEQREAMKAHPVLGAKVLLSTEGVSRLSVVAAFGHHLKHNRMGYPALRGHLRPNPFTAILHVVDVFDALTTNRGYRESWDTYKAVAFMLRGSGTEFDPGVLRAFTQLVGIYPVGTFVELDGREIAQVIKVHSDAVLRPRVRILLESDRSRANPVREIELRERDAEGKSIRHIDRPLSHEEITSLGILLSG